MVFVYMIKKMSVDLNSVDTNRTISYLWNAANLLPKDNPVALVLKARYLQKTIELADSESLILPKSKYGPLSMCQKCSIPWADGQIRIRFTNSKTRLKKNRNKFILRRNKKSKKILRKYVIYTCLLCKTKKKLLIPSKKKLIKNKPKLLKNNKIISKIKSSPVPQSSIILENQMKKITLLDNHKSKSKKNKKNKKLQMNKKPEISKQNVKKFTKPEIKSKKKNDLLQLANMLASSSTVTKGHDRLQQMLK